MKGPISLVSHSTQLSSHPNPSEMQFCELNKYIISLLLCVFINARTRAFNWRIFLSSIQIFCVHLFMCIFMFEKSTFFSFMKFLFVMFFAFGWCLTAAVLLIDDFLFIVCLDMCVSRRRLFLGTLMQTSAMELSFYVAWKTHRLYTFGRGPIAN